LATKDTLGNWTLNRGYPRYTSGKYRGQYVHRVKMRLRLGRKLKRDETVHHRNRNKQDFAARNLQVLDSRTHGWVSAKQYWYMKGKDIQAKKEWDKYFTAQAGGE
jgi:hypothetical protein